MHDWAQYHSSEKVSCDKWYWNPWPDISGYGCISMQRYWSSLRYSFLRTLFLLAADYVVIQLLQHSASPRPRSWEYPSPFYCLIYVWQLLLTTSRTLHSTGDAVRGQGDDRQVRLPVASLAQRRLGRGAPLARASHHVSVN